MRTATRRAEVRTSEGPCRFVRCAAPGVYSKTMLLCVDELFRNLTVVSFRSLLFRFIACCAAVRNTSKFTGKTVVLLAMRTLEATQLTVVLGTFRGPAIADCKMFLPNNEITSSAN